MESFEEVYQKYLKEVYCFLLRLSGDREIAEELTQQTFAIAFEKLENFRGECKLSVWLCQIAKHEYYAWTKKQKRYANKLDENHADQGEDLLNGMGKLAGVSRQTISQIERGDYSPSITLALKIAKICEVSVEDIFIYEEEINDEGKEK